LKRRSFIQSALSGVSALSISNKVLAGAEVPVNKGFPFPEGFLWGAATAAHQVEGNNVNSDYWLLEHLPNGPFVEPSMDACDQYHLYPNDIKLLAKLGFNCYRFSIEWARIEPEKGHFSQAVLNYYRRMTQLCHENGIKPVVTFHHFTSPRWFATQGGWENPESIELFARYCEKVSQHLGDLITLACTVNELNFTAQLDAKNFVPMGKRKAVMAAAAKSVGTRHFSSPPLGEPTLITDNILKAHHKGRAAIKSIRPELPVGLTLTMIDMQSIAGGEEKLKELQYYIEDRFLEEVRNDDFIGVQAYSREFINKDGFMPVKDGTELTQMGYEYWPNAVEPAIRRAAAIAAVPIYVTENGVGIADDTKRIQYIQGALAGVRRCLEDGIDVRSYIHWSLLDNFEWTNGYEPTFGLLAVDRKTLKRTLKPSAKFLGKIASKNRLL
jgi:beta-glucosidase